MFEKQNDRALFCDLAEIIKSCCTSHDIKIEEVAEQFDDFLDQLDNDLNNFLEIIDAELNDR